MHGIIADSTTPTYLDNSLPDHEQDSDINPMNFSSSYHPQFSSNSFYSSYASDPSSMIYNPAYTYMTPTSNQLATSSNPMHFNPYGRYPTTVYQTNNYNTPFFWQKILFRFLGFFFFCSSSWFFFFFFFRALVCLVYVYLFEIKSNNQFEIIYGFE